MKIVEKENNQLFFKDLANTDVFKLPGKSQPT